MRSVFLKHKARILRWVAYALGGIMALVALACVLVKHEGTEETVRRSDGGTATVQTHQFSWRRIPSDDAFFIGGEPIGTLICIADDQRSFRAWWPEYHARPLMAVDLEGGYVLALQAPINPMLGATGYWLGPHGERVPGFPSHLPLRRCVQNLGLTPADRTILANFDPAHWLTQVSSTVSIWIGMIRERPNEYPPLSNSFVKEILDTDFGGERDLLKAQVMGK